MKKLVIFGAAHRGIMLKRSLKSSGGGVFNHCYAEIMFCDNDVTKHHTQIDGVPCLPPKQCLDMLDPQIDIVIISTRTPMWVFYENVYNYKIKNIYYLDSDNFIHELVITLPKDALSSGSPPDSEYPNLIPANENISEYDYKMIVARTIQHHVDNDEYIKELRYEMFTERFISDIKRANVFVDVGGELGYYSCVANRYMPPNGEIHVFEPQPGNFDVLKFLYADKPKFNLYNKAVSNKEGTVTLYSYSEYLSFSMDDMTEITLQGHSDFCDSGKDKIAITTQTIALDDLFGDALIDVIKMDIEGAEVLAFQGMEKILSKGWTKIFLELHPGAISSLKKDGIEYMEYLLDKYNYECFYCVGNEMIKSEFSKTLRSYLVPRKRLYA